MAWKPSPSEQERLDWEIYHAGQLQFPLGWLRYGFYDIIGREQRPIVYHHELVENLTYGFEWPIACNNRAFYSLVI
jgi:hypothetical protein